jgi:NADH-quinone oxidoreductase subunit C
MTHTDIVAILKEKFGDRIKTDKTDAIDPFVAVEPNDLLEVCTFLRDDPRLQFGLLNDISGVDYLEPDPKKAPKAGFEPHLELVYHLSSFAVRPRTAEGHERLMRFTLKVMLPRWKDDKAGALPEVPSVTGLWRTADWHEREVYDLCGVWFVGHPDPTRILLSDDWIGHPLRKDYEFPLEYHGIRGR